MNLRNEFNRVGHLFHNGGEKTQKASEEWMDRGAKEAAAVAQRVRDRIDTRRLVSAEEAIIGHIRENPALYLVGAALLFGALIAKLIIEARESRRAPLL